MAIRGGACEAVSWLRRPTFSTQTAGNGRGPHHYLFFPFNLKIAIVGLLRVLLRSVPIPEFQRAHVPRLPAAWMF